MADEAPHEAPREKKTNVSKNGGGAARRPANGDAWKWAAGAAVAALLLGGGYLVLKNRDSAQTNTDVAYTETPASNAFTSDTSHSGGGTAETASAGATGSSGSQTTSAARSGASRAPAEETIGVRSASASGGRGNDELTVTAKRPVWARKPSARRLATYYPDRALERGREGEARLRCRVENDGDLDCVRASNAPDRDGFGRAALRVSRTLRHAPRLADGSRAYGSSIRLRVVFRMADEDRRRG